MDETRHTARFSLADLMVGIALVSLVLALALEMSPLTLLCSLPLLATCLITRAGGDGVIAAPIAGLLIWALAYIGGLVWVVLSESGSRGEIFADFLLHLLPTLMCGLLAGLFCGCLGHLLGIIWRRVVVGPEPFSSETGADLAPTPPPITAPPPRTSDAPP